MKRLFTILIVLVTITVAYAAVNTENKRAGAGGLSFAPILPAPDGTIDEFDRAQLAGLYPLGGEAAGSEDSVALYDHTKIIDRYAILKKTQGGFIYASMMLVFGICALELTSKFERKRKC